MNECIQINPKDSWSYIMLGNIYARNERNLDVAEFYYEKGIEINPTELLFNSLNTRPQNDLNLVFLLLKIVF